MAGTLVQARSVEGNSAGPSLAFLSNVTAGNLIVVSIAYFSATPAFTSIGDGVNTYAIIDSERVNGSTRIRAYYAKNVAAGATTVAVVLSAAKDYGLAIEEWSGLDTTAPLDASLGATGTSGAPDGGSVTATAGGIVWGAFTHAGTTSPALGEGASFVIGTEQESTTNMPIHTENRGQDGTLSAGAYTTPATIAGATPAWSAISAAFKAAAASVATDTYFGTRAPNRQVGPTALRFGKRSTFPFDQTLAPTTADYFALRVQAPNPRVGPMALRMTRRSPVPFDTVLAPVTDDHFAYPGPNPNNRVGPPVLRARYRPPTFPFDSSLSTATGNRRRRLICSGA